MRDKMETAPGIVWIVRALHPDDRQLLLSGGETDTEAFMSGGSQIPCGDGPGILEIKCPWNRGNIATARPYEYAPFYYMPQVCSRSSLSHAFQTNPPFDLSAGCWRFMSVDEGQMLLL